VCFRAVELVVGWRLAEPGADEADLVAETTEFLGAAPLIVLSRLQLLSQVLESSRELFPRDLEIGVARLAEPKRRRCGFAVHARAAAIASSGGRVHEGS
jgi:hypothetical protein